MEECWDADPSKRPDTTTLTIKVRDMNLYYQSMTDESEIHNNLEFSEANNLVNSTNSRLFTSKIHQFEQRNATEEELEAFHSKSYDFSIPANINDFNKPRNQSNNNTSKLHSIFKANSKNLSKTFEKLPIKDETVQQTKGPNVISDSEKLPKEFFNLQINSNKIIQQQMKRKNIDSDDGEKEVIQQKMKRQNIGDIDDDDEMFNNPNLHSEEQDELEIPDDGF
ncbi:kinase-like domain-containing protein [Rhizophagus irregularis DAOM 181602=DAOM 197198]|nr:kinase-like domain-containing protein [Rhizophagus irregularis DAOM 181602=DAOM 197198]